MWEAGGSWLRKHKGWPEGPGLKGGKGGAECRPWRPEFDRGGGRIQKAARAIQVQKPKNL